MKAIVFGLLLAAMPLGSGCATIINGSTQEVAVSSDPPGASVDIDGEQRLSTPFSVKLERKRDHVLTFTLPGYQTEHVTLNRTVSGAVAGNILAGGLIGWGVDAASGAQYKLVPDTVAMTLRPAGYAHQPPPSADQITWVSAPAPTASHGPTSASGSAWLTQPAAPDVVESKLAQLDRLHTEGKITDGEWRTARQVVISSLQGGE